MDARRAQDILRHIINDEDYGAAMLDKISVTESIDQDAAGLCGNGTE